LFTKQNQGLVGCGCRGYARWLGKIEAMVFVDDSRGHGPVFLQNIGIIGTGNEQDLPYLEDHEFMENLKMGIVIVDIVQGGRHNQHPGDKLVLKVAFYFTPLE